MAVPRKDTHNSDLHDEDSLGQFDADNIVPKAKKELSQDNTKRKQSAPKTQVQTLPKDPTTRVYSLLENNNVEPLTQSKDHYENIDTFSDTSCDPIKLVPKNSPSGQRKSSLPRNIPGGPPELEKQCSQPVPHKCPEKHSEGRKCEAQDNMKVGDGKKKQRKPSSHKMKEDHFIPGHSTALPSEDRKDNQLKSEAGKDNQPTSGERKDNQPKSGERNDNQPKSGERKDNQPKSGEKKDNQPKSGEKKDNQPKSGERKDNQPKSGERKDNQPKSGERKDNQPKSGEKKDNQPKSGERKDNQPKSEEKKDNQPKSGERKDNQPKSGERKDNQPKSGERKDNQPKSGERKDNNQPNSGEKKDNQPKSGEKKDNQPKSGERKDNQPKSGERKDNQSKSGHGPGGAPGPSRGGDQDPRKDGMKALKTVAKIALPVLGGIATIVAAPLVVSALGFGAGGIAAGSLAAKAMSIAWTTGYGVGAVSALQSIGAAGFTLLGLGTLGTGGAAVTAGVQAGVEKMIESTKSSGDNPKNGSGSPGSGDGSAGTSNKSHVGNKEEKKTEENSSSDDETGSDEDEEK